MSQKLINAAGLSERSTKGYFAGGYDDSFIATTDKIVFSSDTTTARTSANLSAPRQGLAGLSEGSTKGYFAGGSTGSSPAVDIADKITFVTDTTVAYTNANLSQVRYRLAGISEGSIKGYFVGGHGYAGTVDTADKITFSTDSTAACTSADLKQARDYLAGLSEGNTKGYAAGGDAGGRQATADKVTFSTDSTAACTSADLDGGARFGLAGLSDIGL